MPKLQSSPFQKHHFIFSLACGSFFVSPAYAGKRSKIDDMAEELGDHPRVCGEKYLNLMNEQREKGSPPRMRGKARGNVCHRHWHGITPAYAGKRRFVIGHSASSWDHPRVCGEKLWSTNTIWRVRGSPPRMRGKARRRSRFSDAAEDHPRVCGEKAMALFKNCAVLGSPPRMRGKVENRDW